MTKTETEWRRLSFLYPGEIEVLVDLASGARTIVEIGVNEGLTARVLLDQVAGIVSYVGVDVLPGYETPLPQQMAEVPAVPGEMVKDDPRFSLVLRPRGSHDLTAADLPMADLVFIDGDHSEAGVTADTALATSIVRPGGLVVWHDYYDEPGGGIGVKDVVDRIPGARRVDGTHLAFLRVGKDDA